MRCRIGPDFVANGEVNVLTGRVLDLFEMVPAFLCIQYSHMRYLHHKLLNVAEPGIREKMNSFAVISRFWLTTESFVQRYFLHASARFLKTET
jgi:hypothetical protein